jgi:hypothetical protein
MVRTDRIGDWEVVVSGSASTDGWPNATAVDQHDGQVTIDGHWDQDGLLDVLRHGDSIGLELVSALRTL